MGDALHVLHALVLEDGRRWGEAAADFQREDAAAILDSSARVPRLHYLTRPRGGSKTTDLAGIALATLLEDFAPGTHGYVFAVDADQAGELLRAASGFVQRTPELAGLVDVQQRRIVTPSGAAWNVVASDAASAFGLRGAFYIFDEFAQLKATAEPRTLWSAVFSAVPKVPGCRLVLLTTAGDPSSWQALVLEQANASAAWRVHEVPGPLAWVGGLDEQRRMLTESQFRRLHLNEWVAPEDRLSTLDDVQACVTHEGVLAPRPGVSYTVGVDLGIKHDASVVVVAHAEGRGDDRRVIVDRVDAFVPRRDAPVDLLVVEEAIRHASRSYNRAHVIADPWQALLMMRNLRSAGVSIDEYVFSAQSVGRIALSLYGLLRDRRIGLPDDAELIDELAHVQLRESSPGVFRLDHDSDRHDDRAVAVALAAHALVDRGVSGRVTTSLRVAARRMPMPMQVQPGRPELARRWTARPRTGGNRL